MNNDEPQNDYDKPVAYDTDGRPLYAHPADEEQESTPTSGVLHHVVHVARPFEPIASEISPELKEKHDRSVQQYPQLDISEHEYVVLSVRRHSIGLVLPFAVSILMICIILTGLILLPDILQKTGWVVSSLGVVYLIGLIAVVLVAASTYVVYWVYINNRFFLTNESIIEKTQLSLFSSNVKSVSLEDVVDVSYRQTGVLEQIFNFGTVQVGTKDDELPYVFHTVSSPKTQASILIDAVERFKNGRPVGQGLEDLTK